MRIHWQILFSSVLLFLSACGGPEPINIVNYPARAFSGKNLLHESVETLDSTETYSMIVQIDRGQRVKIVLNNISEKLPANERDTLADFWMPRKDLNTGWYFEPYDYQNHTQTFFAEGPSTPHLTIEFVGCGEMMIDVYEAGNNVLSSSKMVSWKSFCDN